MSANQLPEKEPSLLLFKDSFFCRWILFSCWIIHVFDENLKDFIMDDTILTQSWFWISMEETIF